MSPIDDQRIDRQTVVSEGIDLQEHLKASATVKQWPWMGNYGDVYGQVNVANGIGVSAREMIINTNLSNGLVAAWMFYQTEDVRSGPKRKADQPLGQLGRFVFGSV